LDHQQSFVDNWQFFLELLCNKSNINTTYQSNHSLETLNVLYNDMLPVKICSLLHLNKNSNKHAMAWNKILQEYSFNQILGSLGTSIVESSALPFVLHSFRNTGSSTALTSIYEVLRMKPQVICPFNNDLKKRKVYATI
jgi:hypothetical protein